MKQLLLVAAFLSLSSLANAQLRLGEPGYGGNGCPAGSANVILSPDQTELSILFDSFMVEASGRTTVDRKSCNLAIPVHVPQGYSVSIINVDYRGFNSLPQGARSSLTAEYFFAGGRGPRTVRNFVGELNSDYLVNDRLQATALVWSRCGESVTLRVNASMMVQTNRRGDQALASVDSADVSTAMLYKFQWKRCN